MIAGILVGLETVFFFATGSLFIAVFFFAAGFLLAVVFALGFLAFTGRLEVLAAAVLKPVGSLTRFTIKAGTIGLS
ncbi:MAG: hypothetical protein F3741_06880 [Nitrospinae bacterium]|nr:hypothetical protein [Nitrospinota bacterium]